MMENTEPRRWASVSASSQISSVSGWSRSASTTSGGTVSRPLSAAMSWPSAIAASASSAARARRAAAAQPVPGREAGQGRVAGTAQVLDAAACGTRRAGAARPASRRRTASCTAPRPPAAPAARPARPAAPRPPPRERAAGVGPLQEQLEAGQDVGADRPRAGVLERLVGLQQVPGGRRAGQQALGDAELEQDPRAQVGCGRLVERALQVGHGALRRAAAGGRAAGLAQHVGDPGLAAADGVQQLRADELGRRAGRAQHRRRARVGQLALAGGSSP